MEIPVLLLAMAIDLSVGDPPNRYRLVPWMGARIAAAEPRVLRRDRIVLVPSQALAAGTW